MDCKIVICVLAAILLSTEGYISNEEPQKRSKPRRLGIAQKRFLSDLTDTFLFKENILKRLLHVRVPGTEGHRLVKEFIIKEFMNLHWDVTLDEFDADTPIGPKKFTNIIATLNPNATKRLIIAAHYDSKLYDSKLNKNQFFVGAIDSAVPCAMMVELARTINPLFDELRKNQDHTLQMVFFDGEEAFHTWTATDSIYGSRHLAQKWENDSQISNIDAMILLDLIGSPNPQFFAMSEQTSKLFQKLAKIEYDMGVSNYFKMPYRVQDIRIEDDHVPFQHRNVPILHVIPVPFPDVWHKFQDDEKNLDYRVIDNLINIFREFIVEEFEVPVPTNVP